MDPQRQTTLRLYIIRSYQLLRTESARNQEKKAAMQQCGSLSTRSTLLPRRIMLLRTLELRWRSMRWRSDHSPANLDGSDNSIMNDTRHDFVYVPLLTATWRKSGCSNRGLIRLNIRIAGSSRYHYDDRVDTGSGIVAFNLNEHQEQPPDPSHSHDDDSNLFEPVKKDHFPPM